MSIDVRPATVFDDVATMVGPKRPDANVCARWCERTRRRACSPTTAARSSGGLWCLRVRPGHRKQGITHALIEGAVTFAASYGAPAVEAYPVDNRGERVDLTMAYVGTLAMFEAAGFTRVSDTDSVLNGFGRVLVRRSIGA